MRFIDLVMSRRVRVVLILGALFASRWYLLGQPPGAEVAAFVQLLGVWLWGESKRRHHDDNILTSRRFLVTLVGQVATPLMGKVGLDMPPEALLSFTTLLSGLVVGESERRHGGEIKAKEDE